MTAEEVVMSAYQAFGAGDMEALAELNHPECTYTFHAEHALGGTYHGFPAFLTFHSTSRIRCVMLEQQRRS